MIKRFIRSFIEMINNSTNETLNILRKRSAEEREISDASSAKIQRKPKKVKYAMLLAYQGQNYFGMQFQRNPAFPTIEGHLFNAMIAHGFITKENLVDLMDWHFQRAARTDRSVSAVGQICSMHLIFDQNFLDNGPSLLNSSLPEDIRVFGIKRVTPSFHAQKICDSRTYSYTLPSFSFASMDEVTNDAYRISPERIADLHELLGCYEGSHNFFNYTSGLEYTEQSARRVIISMTTDEPFLFTDPLTQRSVEFIRIKIRGQSFILHQIRKMIGTILAVMRGFMYKSDIARTFLDTRMDIPKAPGLGLLLERLHYDRFEARYLKTHGSLNNWGDQIETQLLEFRDRMIMNRILSEECRTQNMMKWLSSLSAHKYITDPEDETGENSINTDLVAATKNAMSASNNSDQLLNEENDSELVENDETVQVVDELGELENGNNLKNELEHVEEEANNKSVDETNEENERRKKAVAV